MGRCVESGQCRPGGRRHQIQDVPGPVSGGSLTGQDRGLEMGVSDQAVVGVMVRHRMAVEIYVIVVMGPLRKVMVVQGPDYRESQGE